jgi:hypothetical protein
MSEAERPLAISIVAIFTFILGILGAASALIKDRCYFIPSVHTLLFFSFPDL